jgi:hypothetical protein
MSRGRATSRELVLTAADGVRLTKLESTIELGVTEVGEALREIRDSRLYRGQHSTFEDYCRERWGMSRRHANRQIEAGKTAELLGPIGPKPNEAQARELTKLKDEDEVVEAWSEAQAEAEASGSRLTAKIVRNAVQKRVSRLKREAESEKAPKAPPEPMSDAAPATEPELPPARSPVEEVGAVASFCQRVPRLLALIDEAVQDGVLDEVRQWPGSFAAATDAFAELTERAQNAIDKRPAEKETAEIEALASRNGNRAEPPTAAAVQGSGQEMWP